MTTKSKMLWGTVLGMFLGTLSWAVMGDNLQQLLSDIHQANQMEIQMGLLAQQNSMSDSVKSYGGQLVRDHTDADEQVTTVAQKDSITLLTPAHADHHAMTLLAAKKGTEFDKAFLAQMIVDHQKNITKLQAAQKTLPDSDVKDLVTKILPTLEEHLDRAKSIQANG